ncbi:hypothetical protein J5J10_09295 [Ciceribacter sp. L1K23]|uniref:hypothetical protein n=1 Tax=unclassified Ciceribacter TaxID=2628820 RepID=UPI001ABE81FA|nr:MULTISPECIES: hypothetical protein [unclassified Ciceribacter]MBO3759978.1 hypothetical protein [Ciceribacter sp. L1K22]MBR0555873.1 hypothetical protein [Ciceribacter sp. L1K23]
MAWALAAAVLIVLILALLSRRAAAIVIAVALVVGGVVWLVTDRQDEERAAEMSAVTARADINPGICADPARPVLVAFTNAADRPVLKLSFDLTARLRGHSTLAYRAFLRSDRIIAPGETVTTCQATLTRGFTGPTPESTDLADYEWMAAVTLVEFGR